MNQFKSIFKAWLPIAVVTVALCGLVYATVQQALRQGANDPQIQMAQDAAAALAGSATPQSLLPAPAGQVDPFQSLAPFLVVYDSAGNILASSVFMGGVTPALPGGVLDYVKANGEDRVTWAPPDGSRIAAVIVRVKGAGQFVLAGRSLREVEERETQTLNLCAAACVVTLLVSLVVIGLGEFLLGNKGTT